MPKLTEPSSISLHAWKAFNTASQKMAHHDKARRYRHDSSLTMRRFFHHISLPAADFSCYLQPLQSTGTFHFISHIRIAGACHIKSQDLLLLSGLKNLGVLEIIEPSDEVQPFPRVSDRLVRTWSEEKDAFPKLSILRVCSYHDLTEHSLQYVTKLPALALFEVRGGLQDWQQSERCAAEQGWIACDRSRVRTRPYPPHHQTTNPKSSCLQLTRQVDRPRFLGLDAHYWACWAYESIQTKPLNVCSEDNVGAMSAWESDACRLNVPFASLSLGLDHPYTVERPARSMYDVKMIFFWRQSLFDTDDAPQASTEAPPRMPPLKRNARKAAPERPQSTSQYVKRRRKSNLVDLLEGFQG